MWARWRICAAGWDMTGRRGKGGAIPGLKIVPRNPEMVRKQVVSRPLRGVVLKIMALAPQFVSFRKAMGPGFPPGFYRLDIEASAHLNASIMGVQFLA